MATNTMDPVFCTNNFTRVFLNREWPRLYTNPANPDRCFVRLSDTVVKTEDCLQVLIGAEPDHAPPALDFRYFIRPNPTLPLVIPELWRLSLPNTHALQVAVLPPWRNELRLFCDGAWDGLRGSFSYNVRDHDLTIIAGGGRNAPDSVSSEHHELQGIEFGVMSCVAQNLVGKVINICSDNKWIINKMQEGGHFKDDAEKKLILGDQWQVTYPLFQNVLAYIFARIPRRRFSYLPREANFLADSMAKPGVIMFGIEYDDASIRANNTTRYFYLRDKLSRRNTAKRYILHAA